MNSSELQIFQSETSSSTPQYERLRGTATLGGDAFLQWEGKTMAIVGLGALGSRLPVEIVRSGGSVWCCDLQIGAPENLGTQLVEAGRPKVDAVLAACDAIRAHRARGVSADIRHVGIAELLRLDVLVDATDDPALAWPLTQISNGLAKPLVRLAVDGSGQREFGRVLVSHGGADHACQLCTYGIDDVSRQQRRAAARREARGVGSAIAMAVVGVALLQIQRLACGRHLPRTLDREVLVDLDGFQTQTISLERSAACLSGHEVWQLTFVEQSADEITLHELFARAKRELGRDRIVLEPFAHPLCLGVVCPSCGARQFHVGTQWASTPRCVPCRVSMTWQHESAIPRLGRQEADRLNILETPLAQLGLPREGALITAHARGAPPLRYVLK